MGKYGHFPGLSKIFSATLAFEIAPLPLLANVPPTGFSRQDPVLDCSKQNWLRETEMPVGRLCQSLRPHMTPELAPHIMQPALVTQRETSGTPAVAWLAKGRHEA